MTIPTEPSGAGVNTADLAVKHGHDGPRRLAVDAAPSSRDVAAAPAPEPTSDSAAARPGDTTSTKAPAGAAAALSTIEICHANPYRFCPALPHDHDGPCDPHPTAQRMAVEWRCAFNRVTADLGSIVVMDIVDQLRRQVTDPSAAPVTGPDEQNQHAGGVEPGRDLQEQAQLTRHRRVFRAILGPHAAALASRR